jgi:bacteriocin-like protein
MQGNEPRPQPKLSQKLTLHKETVRVLTDKELAAVAGGAGGTAACTGGTCGCPVTCTYRHSDCAAP